MTPQIFPGLSTPKSKLYFDLQAMIAKNGGRLHLADRLECEMVKSYLPILRTVCIKWEKWDKSETQILIDNYRVKTTKQLAVMVNRNYDETRAKLHRLYRRGLQKRHQ